LQAPRKERKRTTAGDFSKLAEAVFLDGLLELVTNGSGGE